MSMLYALIIITRCFPCLLFTFEPINAKINHTIKTVNRVSSKAVLLAQRIIARASRNAQFQSIF